MRKTTTQKSRSRLRTVMCTCGMTGHCRGVFEKYGLKGVKVTPEQYMLHQEALREYKARIESGDSDSSTSSSCSSLTQRDTTNDVCARQDADSQRAHASPDDNGITAESPGGEDSSLSNRSSSSESDTGGESEHSNNKSSDESSDRYESSDDSTSTSISTSNSEHDGYESEEERDSISQLMETPIRPGSRITVVALVYMVFRWKDVNKATDAATRKMLALLRWVSGEEHRIPSYKVCRDIVVQAGGCTPRIFDACPNDCMVYCGEDTMATRCKVCDTERGATKKVTWFGLHNQIRVRFWSDRMDQTLVRSAPENLSPPDGPMKSIHDSPAWRDAVNSLDDTRRGRTIFGMWSTDGFNPWGMNSVYSIWPSIFRVLNHSPADFGDTSLLILLGTV
jgi:hypothetical protein